MKEKYKQAREIGGYFYLNNFSLIKISGADAATYINSQTSNQVIEISNYSGVYNSLLDRKAHLKATFSMHKLNDNYIILVENNQKESLLEHLENFHFTEDFEQEDISDNYTFLSIQGEKSTEIIKKNFDLENFKEEENNIIYNNNLDTLVIVKDLFFDNGFFIITKDKELIISLEENLKTNNFIELSEDLLEVLRIEVGTPKYDIDMNEENLIPETGLEKTHVSYNKGCYLGQEVVARIKTYGTAPKALIGLIFENKTPNFNSDIILDDGKNIGKIKSSTYSYLLDKYIALAYLNKDFRNPDTIIKFEEYVVKVSLLPFYKKLSKEEKSKNLYEKALSIFAENKEEEAIELLKKSIELQPNFPDAYEALGVILSRLEKYDEAIDIMNKLTEIAPDEPMARTNLSIFYMKKGDKEEAEKQMAMATTLKFKKTASEAKQKKAEEELKKQQLQAIYERMEMFKEVLETEDPDDLIANYGMGKAYFDLNNYKEAIPYLKKSIEIKRDYSTAYLYLGKSLEFIDNDQEALQIYKIGIAEASKKGDLMPLKEMEKRKDILELTKT
ncbi:MAG: tetratricopeptide repeat protein [Candidatus Sericytochromatia bacterium]